MLAPHPLLSRLEAGRPLLLSGDLVAGLCARGATLPDAAEAGVLVRERAADLADLYHHEIGAGADVLCATTGETLPRALQRAGMAFRAAALTGAAIDLALEAAEVAPRPVLVAGALGSSALAPTFPDRLAEELEIHAVRLVTAGCKLILARGFERAAPDATHDCDDAARRLSRGLAIASGAATGVPTWAVVGVGVRGDGVDPGDEPLAEAAARAAERGASAILFEINAGTFETAALAELVARICGAVTILPVGVMLAAHGALASPDEWAAAGRAVLDAGARALGGGAGTTSRHLAALSSSLRKGERSSLFPPSM